MFLQFTAKHPQHQQIEKDMEEPTMQEHIGYELKHGQFMCNPPRHKPQLRSQRWKKLLQHKHAAINQQQPLHRARQPGPARPSKPKAATVHRLINVIGTSLPEIAFVISSKARDNQREILGDIVGSVVANSTLVLGIAATIYPIKLAQSSFVSSTIFFLTISLLLFLKFTISKQKLEKSEALVLTSAYVIFVLTEYFLQTQVH